MRKEVVEQINFSEKTKVSKSPISKAVRIWLFIGVAMVFMQVVIGGITRLTDSGLSITEWAVIQGTIPPLNEAEWRHSLVLKLFISGNFFIVYGHGP